MSAHAADLTSHFYALLFIRQPGLRDLFPPMMDAQRDRLLQAIVRIVTDLDNAEALTSYLQQLGRDHRKYDVLSEHYTLVGDCLLAALARYSGDHWDEATAAAWTRAYTTAAGIMTAAADEDSRVNPAHWTAEIVAHERHGRDIAVVTVRPDKPYPYRGGQYATLETPWWPRVWRAYSIANAPNAENLLTFHVRALAAGWVSSALVNSARVGDRVKLGPAMGAMVADLHSDRPVLCVAGGTGVAPLQAMVEEIATHGYERYVDLFYGASGPDGLYGLNDLLRLSQKHSWFKVRPVPADIQLSGMGGTVAGVLAEYGPRYDCSAYLSGPPPMVRDSVRVLRRMGLPRAQIHHDPLIESLSETETSPVFA